MDEWTFEKEDFLTPAPYEALYKFHKEPFVHATKMAELSAYAERMKFRGFKAMYKRYVESLKVQSGTVYIDNVTSFTGQPMELNAGDWEAEDTGIFKKNGFNDEMACPHPIMPIERLVNIDTGEEKLKLAFRKGAIWRKIIVSKIVLANSNKVTELAGSGIAVTSQTARAFVSYISDLENLNYDIIPERKSIGRCGYIADEGFSPFVEGLIFDGDANFKGMFEAIRSRGSVEKWLETAKEVRGMSLTARILLAASFASPLLEPLNCLPFFVHLWGVDSGTGKTVALMVAASVWGDPTIGSFVKTFDGTTVGLEKTAAFLNNLPLCLDELQLAKDLKGRTNFDVYKLAQGVGRTRGNRSGGVDLTPTWRNCILTTGESPLTGQAAGAGAVNRVLDIECRSAQAVIRDGMRISSIIKRNYGFAGRIFVEELYQPGVLEQVTERYRQLFQQLNDMDTTEKQAMAAAAIILADELASRWIFQGTERPLTIEQISEFLASRAAVSAGDRGYQYLCDWVTQHSNQLVGRSDTVEVLGALDGNRAYIIRSVFERILQDAGYSTAAMISYLKQEHLLETRGRANTKGKRINGLPTECFCLILPAVELDDEELDELPL
uniref:Active helicase ring shaped helicase n=1 Tax=Siphoviridae sp. ctP6113 TaxID=2826318 RepID=A0A8S5MUB2_9CAUD|nr:MAG TPA: active helicase ring shaped helicase [Siphoviridae sp. ctP6113]